MLNSAGKKLAAAIGVVVLVLLAGYAIRSAYLGYWGLNNNISAHSYSQQQKNIARQNTNIQDSFGVQQGYQTAITAYISTATNDIVAMPGAPDASALHIEAINAGDNACLQALKLVPSALAVPAQMQSWINGNCSAGTLKLTSPIRTGNGN